MREPFVYDPNAVKAVESEFIKPTREELSLWMAGAKVHAMRQYRERTSFGLYESKKNLEAAERNLSVQDDPRNVVFEKVTSCG